jgi:hypothetical protein
MVVFNAIPKYFQISKWFIFIRFPLYLRQISLLKTEIRRASLIVPKKTIGKK